MSDIDIITSVYADRADQIVRDGTAGGEHTWHGLLAEYAAAIRYELARQIDGKYLGPDSGRDCNGNEPPDAAERMAFDQGLHEAAMLVRNGDPS